MPNANTTTTEPSALAAFWEEFVSYWRRWPGKALWFCLLIAWVLLFQFRGNSTFGYIDTPSLFRWMHYSYTQVADDEHGLLMPAVVLVLFWFKRKELLELAGDVWWPALAVVVLALGLHLVAYLVQQTRISIIAFFLGIYGLLGFVWGRAFMRASFFPMALFIFAIPLSSVSETVTYPLRTLVAKISVGIGNGVFAIPLVRQGSQIIGPEGAYDVAPACSGIRSLTALGAVTMIYAFMGFATPWRRVAILLAAFPLAVAGNVARVTTVLLLGDVFGKQTAMQLEQYLGLITFATALACLFLIGRWMPEPEAAAPAMRPQAA